MTQKRAKRKSAKRRVAPKKSNRVNKNHKVIDLLATEKRVVVGIKRKHADKMWSKRAENESKKSYVQKDNILRMRSDQSTAVTLGNGLVTPLKTSVIVRGSPAQIKPNDVSQFVKEFKHLCESTPYHRPPAKVTFSANGTPIQLETPEKTVLHPDGTDGISHRFSNREKKASAHGITSLNPSNPLFQSDNYAAVKENDRIIKNHRLVVTAKLISDTHQKIKKGISRNQNVVMAKSSANSAAASANQYAHATEQFPKDSEWEWLHLVAFYIVKEKGQHELNLGAGTAHANTEMIPVENFLAKIAKQYPNGFVLNIKGHFIHSTQLLIKIVYTIEIPGRHIRFTFDAQQMQKPHFVNKIYTEALIKSLLTLKNNDVSISPTPQATLASASAVNDDTPDQNYVFFKSRKRQKIERTAQVKLCFDEIDEPGSVKLGN